MILDLFLFGAEVHACSLNISRDRLPDVCMQLSVCAWSSCELGAICGFQQSHLTVSRVRVCAGLPIPVIDF